MKAWHFSETAYPYLPPADSYETVRIKLPNDIYDPAKGAALYDRYLDEWLVAEDEGLEIMLNEHHQTPTCTDPAGPVMLGALARLSKKARLLILGNPIANRQQPVRIAEEMAVIDVLSHGRLEAGFVRGVPWEVIPANSNPVRMNERHAEALDLIIKAWTHRGGPFVHEGRFFHYRAVNIWPRPYQQPHPPVWVSTTSPAGAARVGQQGHIQATFLSGLDGTRRTFEAYRRGWREAGRGHDVPIDRLATAVILYTAPDEKTARHGADKLCWYLTSNKVTPHHSNPAGYVSVDANVAMTRGAVSQEMLQQTLSYEKLIEMGAMMAGTPDQVVAQFKRFYDHVGGFGHLLIMGQAGFLDHEETVLGIKTFGREVLPRLKEMYPETMVCHEPPVPAGSRGVGMSALGPNQA